ncbi:MAG: ribosomal-protein-alanine N-acetyltransferase [Paracoccaceae bacterium]|jgi:ribosomal-protein-alanine N-acetyltransferase
MTGYELSVVEETDIGTMARIHALSFDDAWTGAMIRRILAMPGAFGIVARQGRQWTVAGFALLRQAADECEVLSLVVSPELRGDGVGGFLLDGAMEQASVTGATKLFLEVAEDNDVARRLYSSRGLIPVGRRPDYYTRKDGTTAAAVTMSCQLEAQAVRTPA